MENSHESKSIARLHTVIMNSLHIQQLARFYGDGLGLGPPRATGKDHLGFQLPNAYVGFDQVEDQPKPSGVVSLWFEVEDIQTTYERFQSLGAKVKYAPSRKPWGGYLAALYDLDGNVFGLTQQGEWPMDDGKSS